MSKRNKVLCRDGDIIFAGDEFLEDKDVCFYKKT